MLTTEKIKHFIESKDALRACPCCGKTAWNVVTGPDGELEWSWQGLKIENSSMEASGSILTAFVVACTNCYFMRPHAFLPASMEIEQNELKKDEGSGNENSIGDVGNE